MNTVEKLLTATKEIWTAYMEHPFVLGIQEGTLPEEKFRYYILQDYLYLQEYVKTFAIGVAKTKQVESMKLFAHYIHVLLEGEMDIHRGYMGRFGITQEELDNTPRALDNLSYTSYMLRVAYEEGEAEILAAILSCAYSYEVIAKTIVQRNPEAVNHPLYGEWVQGYASAEYAEENKVLIDMLNQMTANYGEQQLQHLIDIFVACSRYELAFWELSWKQSK